MYYFASEHFNAVIPREIGHKQGVGRTTDNLSDSSRRVKAMERNARAVMTPAPLADEQ